MKYTHIIHVVHIQVVITHSLRDKALEPEGVTCVAGPELTDSALCRSHQASLSSGLCVPLSKL